MWKTGHFRAKPDPGRILSGKIFLTKSFFNHTDFKNDVFRKPDFWPKNRIRTSGNMWDHKKSMNWVYLNDILMKMQETRYFRRKPETGQNLSRKFFSSGIPFLSVHFNNTFIFSKYNVYPKLWNKWLKIVTTE